MDLDDAIFFKYCFAILLFKEAKIDLGSLYKLT